MIAIHACRSLALLCTQSSGLIPTKGCFGGWPATALGFFTQKGAILESSYAYAGVNGAVCADNATKLNLVKGYAVIPPLDVQGIQQAIADNGAVVSIVQVGWERVACV